ncbi:MAG TPA: PP2C family protein-serine/threonine phosphatase, partial [Roseiflexaceae bacterium]|nr:PP2C family protein-serine/threonine phosphatase [Roseiflexaceae bacterium]
MSHYRETRSPTDLLVGLWCQAPVLLATGAIEAVEQCCAEGLALVRQVEGCPWSLRLLELRATAAAMRGQPGLAAHWWGAAADLRERLGVPLWPVERPDYEAQLAAARAALGGEAFAAAFTAGRSLGWEQLVDGRIALPAPSAMAAVRTTATQELAYELATAAAIQAGLLPAALPEPQGWRLAARLIPAHETAGDFYDCMTLSDGRLGLVIADVAGKGLGPALYMATGRALIRTLVGDGHVEPADVLARVNTYLLKETHADLFITLFYGVLDPARGTLVYANAGHPPPLVMSAHDPARMHGLAPTGLVLGVEHDVIWKQQAVQLIPGDVVLLYTDGVTEAQDSCDSFFETERLVAALRASLRGGAEAAVAGVLAAVRTFAGTAPQSDDITLLAAAWDSDLDRA